MIPTLPISNALEDASISYLALSVPIPSELAIDTELVTLIFLKVDIPELTFRLTLSRVGDDTLRLETTIVAALTIPTTFTFPPNQAVLVTVLVPTTCSVFTGFTIPNPSLPS